MVKDSVTREMTADAEDDTYLDDDKMQTGKRQPRAETVGDTSRRWPGVRVTAAEKLVQLFDSGEVCAFRIKYPNGTVDVFRGWLSLLVKPLPQKT
nr:phage tail tube protein [Escherichia coli]